MAGMWQYAVEYINVVKGGGPYVATILGSDGHSGAGEYGAHACPGGKAAAGPGSRAIVGGDGFQGGSAMLLRLQAVQHDLQLSEQQKGLLADLFADLAAQGRDMFSNMHVLGLQNLSDEDRQRA